AAHTRRARLGFDAEDFHRGELPETFDTLDQRALVEAIEKKYIPRCDYVSAASAGIAREYARALDIALPHVILNTSALSERSGLTPAEALARERRGGGLTLYWYSQVIGPGRGVCDALRAVARL